MVLLWRKAKSMDFITVITFLLFLMPTISSSHYLGNNLLTHRKILAKQQENITTSYAVVFDAGSTGSRVHVYHFDQNLDLLHIGNDVEFYNKTTPGLSSYANNPEQAATSLIPLLKQAERVVPQDLHTKTPVTVGATAGLRLLDGNASELILEAVRDMLNKKSTLKVQSDAVAILDGTQEGSYLWVTITYVLGKLGKGFSKTVGVADLGGGSVQMVYAVPKNQAKKAPKVADGEDSYIKEVVLKGKQYYLYVHSYLHFGKEASRAETHYMDGGCVEYMDCTKQSGVQRRGGVNTFVTLEYQRCGVVLVQSKEGEEMWGGVGGLVQLPVGRTFHIVTHYSSRAEILKVTNGSANPCILAGYDGTYTYSNVGYKAFAPASGSNFEDCRDVVLKALKVNEPCPHPNCTFGGIWNGGGGSGQKKLYVTSSFYYVPADVGIVDASKPNSKIHIADLKTGAKRACKTKYKDANASYPLLDESSLPYACLDLTYQYTLFVDGFGLDAGQEITVANQIEYQDSLVDAAWPLGNAIEAISSLTNFKRLMYFI